MSSGPAHCGAAPGPHLLGQGVALQEGATQDPLGRLREGGGRPGARLCLHKPSSLSWETRCSGLPWLPRWGGPRGGIVGLPAGFEGLPASVLHKGGSVNPARLQSRVGGSAWGPGAVQKVVCTDPGPVRHPWGLSSRGLQAMSF